MCEKIIMIVVNILLLCGLAITFYAENTAEFVNKYSKKGKDIYDEREEDKLEKIGKLGKKWRIVGVIITAFAILIDIILIWR